MCAILTLILFGYFLGKAFAFGCDTVGQLGLGLKDEDNKIVSTPELIHSAHLNGYKILSVSLSDNHALFLAAEEVDTKLTGMEVTAVTN